jgi:hypothetical protein
MTAQDFAPFKQLLGAVMAYYRQDVSDFMLDIWWQACKASELEQITRMLSAYVKDPVAGVYPPKVADIVRLLEGTPTDRAQLAWGKVFPAMGRVGAYTDVLFDDAVIHAVVRDLGGWPKLCRTPLDELGYVQTRFLTAYAAYSRQPSFTYPAVLIGERSADALYLQRNLPLPSPVVIGEKGQAQKVYALGQASGEVRGQGGPASLAGLIPMRTKDQS